MTELRENINNLGVRCPAPIVFALDEDYEKSKIWIQRLSDKVWGFKVGSILFTERGPQIIEEVKASGAGLFLDLKYHDIPRTVQFAVRQAFRLGADWISLHAAGGRAMLEAAAQEQDEQRSLLAISVLTSLDAPALKEIGVSTSPADQVMHLAKLAMSSGIKGLVSSVQEVKALRQAYPESLLVTPGIRLNSGNDDQKRTGSFQEALEAGSTCLVLGRALYDSKDWEKTWEEIQSSLGATHSSKP